MPSNAANARYSDLKMKQEKNVVERTLVMLKPDCMQRRLTARVLGRFEDKGLNVVGLKRRDFTRDVIHALRTAYRLLFAEEGTMVERLNDVAAMFGENEPGMDIVAFIGAESPRGLCQPRPSRGG